MRLVGNILWLLFAGVWMFIAYIIAGVINCIFIITIPFGIQSFKLAGFALWPFGRVVVDRPGAGVIRSGCGNLIWLFTGGIWLALGVVPTQVVDTGNGWEPAQRGVGPVVVIPLEPGGEGG